MPESVVRRNFPNRPLTNSSGDRRGILSENMKTRTDIGFLTFLACLLLQWVMNATAQATDETVDLRGTWFLLIHYSDPESANPEATRWRDLVWSFSLKGSRLQWQEYPIVYFEDSSGRFEALGDNPRSRILSGWEPNAKQMETIMNGPRVNSRGAKTKTLKGSNSEGWRSSRRRAQTSASVLGYHESLSIEKLEGQPIFERRDIVGNALSQSAEGLTRFEVTEILEAGKTLIGRYERDGRHRGVFRMWRTPPARGLEKKDRTPNERARDALLRKAGEAP